MLFCAFTKILVKVTLTDAVNPKAVLRQNNVSKHLELSLLMENLKSDTSYTVSVVTVSNATINGFSEPTESTRVESTFTIKGKTLKTKLYS